jgi:hypothetical protein
LSGYDITFFVISPGDGIHITLGIGMRRAGSLTANRSPVVVCVDNLDLISLFNHNNVFYAGSIALMDESCYEAKSIPLLGYLPTSLGLSGSQQPLFFRDRYHLHYRGINNKSQRLKQESLANLLIYVETS